MPGMETWRGHGTKRKHVDGCESCRNFLWKLAANCRQLQVADYSSRKLGRQVYADSCKLALPCALLQKSIKKRNYACAFAGVFQQPFHLYLSGIAVNHTSSCCTTSINLKRIPIIKSKFEQHIHHVCLSFLLHTFFYKTWHHQNKNLLSLPEALETTKLLCARHFLYDFCLRCDPTILTWRRNLIQEWFE